MQFTQRKHTLQRQYADIIHTSSEACPASMKATERCDDLTNQL